MIKKENVKQCRKSLKLNQAELSGVGMSREYISDVERGKSTLNAEKASLIVKKLMLHSLKQNRIIDLGLNENDICKLDLINEHKSYVLIMNIKNNHTEDDISLFATLNEIADKPSSEFRFFVYILLANIHLKKLDYLSAYVTSKIALDIAFTSDYDLSLFNINENIKFFRDLSFKTEKATDIIRYYKQLISITKATNKKCQPFTYYNLALFEKINHEYSNAISNLDTELFYNQSLSKNDYLDIIMLKASLLFKLNMNNDGLVIYVDIINKHFEVLSDNRKSMVASNFIYFYTQNNMTTSMDLLNFCENYLLRDLNRNPESYEKRYRVYANIGLLKKSQEYYTDALFYFERSFEIYFTSNSSITSAFIHLLEESKSVYLNSNQWAKYLSYLGKCTYDDLSKEYQIRFLKLIASVLFIDTDRSNSLIKQLKQYI